MNHNYPAVSFPLPLQVVTAENIPIFLIYLPIILIMDIHRARPASGRLSRIRYMESSSRDMLLGICLNLAFLYYHILKRDLYMDAVPAHQTLLTREYWIEAFEKCSYRILITTFLCSGVKCLQVLLRRT